MTSSVPIPKRKQPIRNNALPADSPGWDSPADTSSSSSSSSSSTYSSPAHSNTYPLTPSLAKGKFAATTPYTESISPRRPSLLGSSLAKSEHTVINLGPEDGPPRLVTCVKSSQGFDWNQELFLPSYADFDAQDLEHKPDPVQEIILTDEEAAAMLPQW